MDEASVVGMLTGMIEDGPLIERNSSATLTEAELTARLRTGDDEAFEELIRRYGSQLLAVIRRYLPEESDAQDALQEALLSVFKAIERFHGDSSLPTWLHRIAVNAALMKLRTRRRRPEKPIEDLLPHFADDGHRADPRADWSVRPDDAAQNMELRGIVRAAIDELPESYRTILLLRDIEERSTEEVADLLELSLANVKTRLHRARQALRELLDRRLGETAR
ncbi:MAG: sigma-70 family RNA polymerase sigma factor [Pirellulales bacterium]